MDYIDKIKSIYNSRSLNEQKILDLIIESFVKVDFQKLHFGETYSFILNEDILTIALQHKNNSDRRILFLLQKDFLEIHIECQIKVFNYLEVIDDSDKINELRDFLFLILGNPYQHIEYYLDDSLIKYTSIWSDNSIRNRTIYLEPFGRLIEVFNSKRIYEIKERVAESFLIDELN